MERETSLGEEEVAWEQGWWVGSVWKNTQEAETRGKACEGDRVHGDRGERPSGCSWGTAREAGRLMEPAATPGKQKVSAQAGMELRHGDSLPASPSRLWPGRPGRWAPGRKLAPSRPGLRSCTTAPQPPALPRTEGPTPRPRASESSTEPQQVERSPAAGL